MKTIAIVVLYNDNTADAARNIATIAHQVDKVCLVDNSSIACPKRFESIQGTVYMPLYQNIGIAAAQNVGLQYAFEQRADFVLFADPDSVLPEQAVCKLQNFYQRLIGEGYHVGGVGSTAYNRSTGSPYPLNSNFIQKLETGVTEVTFLMNSISLIPATLFSKVGLMDESLFIDGIDSEWCWRGRKLLGLRYFLDENLRIMHQLGLGTRIIAGKERSITPPARLFYQYRNFLWLCRRKYVPRKWLLENGQKYLLKAVYYPLMMAPRWQYLVNICKGIMAGLHKPTAYSTDTTSGT